MSQDSSSSEELRLGKHTPIYHHDPKKKTFQILLKFQNKPGSLASILDHFAKNRLDILSSFSYNEKDYSVWSGFVQHEDQSHGAREIGEITSNAKHLISHRVSVSERGLLIDTLTFPVVSGGSSRYIMMSAEHLQRMMMKIVETFGSGGESILFNEGLTIGEATAQSQVTAFGKQYVLDLFSYTFALYSAIGWGRAQLVRFEPMGFTAVIRMHECFECAGQHQVEPRSMFIKGHLAGVLESLFERKITVRETMCLAIGESLL